MPAIPALGKTWANGEVLTHTDLNGNFATIRDGVNNSALFRDVASQTVSVAITFSVSQTFSAGIAVTGAITMATSTSQIVPGATSFSVRNTANSADNLLVSDAGAVTVRNGLTVTAGGATITAGGLTVTAGGLTVAGGGINVIGNVTLADAASRLVPGATSFAVRNNANSADNLLVADSGNVTVRGALTVSGNNLQVAGHVLGNNLQITNQLALATNATDGFLLLSHMAGAPTGIAPERAMVLDTSNLRLYIRTGSAWRYTALT